MATFFIPKRIDLFPIIKLIEWQDTYIIVKSCNAQDIKEFQRTANQAQKDLQSLKNDPEASQEIIQEKEMQTFDVLVDFVKNRFISGVVFDFEEKKKVEINKEDIEQFNLEILQTIIAEMFGQGNQLKKN